MITKNYTHLGLFEGIGGFSLAAHWMGWKTIAWCEWNPFGQHVLKSLFPEAEGFSDITKTDFTKYANKIDIITGGFPCQPFSTAGKRKGTDDARYLWPEMLRAIREIRPRWVIGENVYGLVNWDGGLVFDTVCADLENEGFEVWPVVLPAAGVNAPHRRDRIWFIARNTKLHGCASSESGRSDNGSPVASGTDKVGQPAGTDSIQSTRVQRPSFNPDHKGTGDGLGEIQSQNGKIPQRDNDAEPGDTNCEFTTNPEDIGHEQPRVSRNRRSGFENGYPQPDTHTGHTGLQGREQPSGSVAEEGQIGGEQPSGSVAELYQITDWSIWPTVPPICDGNDGVSELLDADTVSEVAGKKVRNAFSWWRQESIKAGGNAIVPQVALQIFRTINEFEEGEALM